MVRDTESKVKRYRGNNMMQRWLASALLYCERRFRRIKGYVKNIEAAEEENTEAALLVNEVWV